MAGTLSTQQQKGGGHRPTLNLRRLNTFLRVLPSVCCAPQMSSAVFSERSGLLGRPERCLLSRPNYTRFSFQERSYQFRVLAWPVSGPAGGYPMYTNGTNAPLIKRPGRKDSAASGRLACRCPHRTAGTQGHAQLVHTYALGLTVNIDKSGLTQCWPLFPWVETRRYCHPSGI